MSIQPSQADDGMRKIEVVLRDPDDQLVKMIEHIRRLAGPGHSFIVVVDPDATRDEGKETFSMDGDGAFYIDKIKYDGKPLKMDGNKIVENYLKRIQC